MLSTFRSSLNTWPVRMFFLLLVAAFVLWGIGDVVRVWFQQQNWAAKVAGYTISLPEYQQAYQKQLSQVERTLPGSSEPTSQMRQLVANQAIEQLVTRTAISAEDAKMHIQVTNAALSQVVYSMPAFMGPTGKFSQSAFQTVLQRNGISEGRFLDMLRADLADKQLISAVRAGATPPAILTRNIFAFRNEKRVASAVELPFAAAPAPPAPTAAQLQRWWENHPDFYSSPAFRRIKAVILSPETLAKYMTVSEDDLRAAYESRKADFHVPEKRTVQVLVTQVEAKARTLAAQWQGGADWTGIEKAAKDAGGVSAVQLDQATESLIPLPSLAKAVFAAKPDAIEGPLKTELGWYVFKVATVIPPTNRSLDAVKAELRQQVALQKASDAIYDRANKVEDALAGGATLSDLPGNLGLAAVTGTLDAKGMTPTNVPAPIPGPAALRQAVIDAAFRTRSGEPPHLVEVPPPPGNGQDQVSSYYALEVEKVTPPAVKPFDQVKQQVVADWTKAAIRHEQNQAATNIFVALEHGQSLDDAALKAGVSVRKLPAVGRDGNVEGVPQSLVRPLFSLKKGEATMVETPTGFEVAVLSAVEEPSAKAEPGAYDRVVAELQRSFADDVENTFVQAVRTRDNPRINRQLVNSMAQP